MTATEPSSTPQPIVPDTTIARIVYILYFLNYFAVGLSLYFLSYNTIGFTAVIGLIVARVQAHSADPMLATHYRFQIRTFWIGLLFLAVGVVLSLVVIEVVVAPLLLWFIWSLIRNIKGVLALNKRRPIANPGSWLFG